MEDGSVLLSNDAGFTAAVSRSDFSRFSAGRLGSGEPLYGELAAKGFVR